MSIYCSKCKKVRVLTLIQDKKEYWCHECIYDELDRIQEVDTE